MNNTKKTFAVKISMKSCSFKIVEANMLSWRKIKSKRSIHDKFKTIIIKLRTLTKKLRIFHKFI